MVIKSSFENLPPTRFQGFYVARRGKEERGNTGTVHENEDLVWSEARLSRNSSCKLFIFNQLHIVRLSLFREPFESLLPIALLVGFHPLIDVLLAVFDHQID